MKKILLLLLALIVTIPAYLFASGKVSTTSIAMMLNVMTGRGVDTPATTVIEQRLKLPEGFSLGLYAGELPRARFLKFTSGGDLLVSRPHNDDIVLLRRNPDTPERAGEQITLLSGLTRPSGLDIAGGWLFIGESNAVGRVRFDEASGAISGEYEHIITGLTDDGNHPNKVVRIGPDQKLYLSQGSTCNVCLEDDPRRNTISRYNLDGSGEELIASGLRNSMGLAFAPWDGALYATDNGRDMLGDDYPPCELNKIEAGNFYGWPYFNGANEPDPDFGEATPPEAENPVAPVHEFRAHNAPLGLGFIDTSTTWPDRNDRVALVALHGSWNRSTPDGYRVVSLHWQDGKISSADFLTGFEHEGDIIGRPVDVAQGPDGAIYISDDYAGAIYRVTYSAGSDGTIALGETPLEPFELAQPEWLNDDNSANLQEQGRDLFARYNCSGCHNPKATMGNMTLDDIGGRLQYSEVIDRLINPTTPMPLYPLDAGQQRAMAVYLVNRK